MLVSLFSTLLHLLGTVSAVHAVLNVRTSQGAIAWALSLLTAPYMVLPLYWVFGRNHFHGYVEALREIQNRHDSVHQEQGTLGRLQDFRVTLGEQQQTDFGVLAEISRSQFTCGNRLKLLIDGESTFDTLLQAVDQARDYVLMQFFIIRDDQLGQRLLSRLVACAQRGVSVRLLFDEIGSHALGNGYLQELQRAGVEVKAFHNSIRGFTSRFQLNFRNHRKITIIDGKSGFVGGLNVGDEYLGKGPLGYWRDTHLEIRGPAVLELQQVFAQDWFWASRNILQLNWQPVTAASSQNVLIHATGPADTLDACSMFFHQCIVAARQRLWIASPYFVPGQPVFEALQLAALRGVDVRILLPSRPDYRMVYLASFSFLEAADQAGIKLYRYQQGFLHQKVVLVDDQLAAIGTSNLDNRSLHLNFEVMAVVADRAFAGQVASMLERDFAGSRQTSHADLLARGWLFRLGVRLARLFDPIL